jgi:hypothetical protein
MTKLVDMSLILSLFQNIARAVPAKSEALFKISK